MVGLVGTEIAWHALGQGSSLNSVLVAIDRPTMPIDREVPLMCLPTMTRDLSLHTLARRMPTLVASYDKLGVL